MSDVKSLVAKVSRTNEFQPVQCTQEVFDRLTPAEGYLYFTTDTKKIYLGKSSGMLPMCANTGIFYGTKQIKYENNGLTPDPKVFFTINDIEGNDKPEIDDLILNVDGCFYRVKTISANADTFMAERLTLQGSSVGGGGGGGNTPGGGSDFSIAFSNASRNFTFSSVAEEMNVGVISYRQDAADNYLSSITFTIGDDENTEPFITEVGPLAFNEMHPINLAPYKHLFKSTNTDVKVRVYDKYGASREDTIKVRLISISLTEEESALIPALSSELSFKCNLEGGTTGVSSKKLVYSFYKEEDLYRNVLTIEYPINVNDSGIIPKNLNLSTLEHGIYVLKVQAFATITGAPEPVPSNILTHKIGYFIETTSPLLLVLAPEKTEQYTNIPVKYLYVTNEVNKTYTMELRINNVFYKNIIIQTNVENKYDFYFEDAENKRILFTVLETGVSSAIELNLTAYTGQLPVIDLTRDDLMLYLNPRGKTNNDVDRDTWLDAKKGQLAAKLEGVTYSQLDGWCIDSSTNEAYLKLISGATLSLPDFMPFSIDPAQSSGMTIELDFEINGITKYTDPILSCVSYDRLGTPTVGFELIGDQFKMYSSRLNGKNIDPEGKVKDSMVAQTIVEGKRVKMSIVIEPQVGDEQYPMCYAYLNGKMTEATIQNEDDHFIDSYYPATLKIDSSCAQVKIYSIRFYNTNLNERLILNNYTAALSTLAERQKVYDSNNVYVNNLINFDLVSDKEYNLQIPYMKLTGGYKSSSNDKWAIDTTANVGLPTGKKDYRLVDIEVVYPKNEYFKNYKDYSFINTFENGLGMADNLGNRANNGGAIMYCQGTSSMEYPVKNLRLRWKNKDNYFSVRPNLPEVEIICMKADYMESSGSHNTGAANLIDKLYSGANMKTPGQLENWNGTNWINGKETVTCIKGHPCLIFYSETGEPGTYEYIGKYNLNLDKATPEPFGFYHNEENNFGYLKDENGEVILDENNEKQNSIFCYEFLDNAAYPVCNFLITSLPDKDGVVPTTYDETWHNIFWHEKDKKYYPGWRMGFESRYPEDEEDVYSAEAFYPVANWVNELYQLRLIDESVALNRFKNEYWKYFDKEFLLTYYLVTEALLMADSRVKNMMIATWGPEWRFLLKDGSIAKLNADGSKPAEDKIQESYFGYIFYPIFYDMDTMLGLNNEGRMKFKYYTEDTEDGVYNGANVLWHLVRDSLPSDLIIYYNILENSGLHAPSILPYFNENQATMANEAFYNGDAAYKYVIPSREGYEDLLNGNYIEPGAAPYLYALQGDRALHRESFINNRMQYLRGKYASSKFLAGDRVAFRWYTPTDKGDGSAESLSAKAVPPLVDGKSQFTFTGLKTGFAGIQLGENGVVNSYKFTPGQSHTFDLYAAEADGTEAFLLGLSTLSDVGDLSNKYMGKFVISSPNNRLERLTLGNPNKFYYNTNWATGTENIIVNSQYLEYFNLQNCSTYNRAIDLTGNPVVNTVLMTGSGVTSLSLPENGVLTELRLPDTLGSLRIVGHKDLEDSQFSMGTYKYGSDDMIIDENFDFTADYNLIGGPGGSYVDNFINIKDLHIVDTKIDTYRILKGTTELEKYYLHGIDWHINEIDPTQYCVRKPNWKYPNPENPEEEITLGEKVTANKYYTLTIIVSDDGSKEYQWTLWDKTTYPEGINYLYEKMDMLDNDNNIICIPMLEFLLTLNTKVNDPSHDEALSGTITINVPNTKAVELLIYDKYKNIYPNITIKYGSNVELEAASTINFYSGTADKEYVESVGSIEGLIPGYFTRTAAGVHSLAELIGDYKPVKVSTISNNFIFTGEWIDWADNNKTHYYQALPNFPIPEGKEAFSFTEFKPSKNMDLVPVFKTEVRNYTIKLYDYNGTKLIEQDLPYNISVYDGLISKGINESSLEYQYRDDSDIKDKENYRWTFQGWISEQDYLNNAKNPVHYNLSDIIVDHNFVAYAHYSEENFRNIATKEKYFDFEETTISDSLLGTEIISGYRIHVKEMYRNILEGKITLPQRYNNTSIIEIGDFAQMPKITHVYFQNKEQCNYIQTIAKVPNNRKGCGFTCEGFPKLSQLQVVDLPPSFRIINNRAFCSCCNLVTLTLNDNILRIGDAAIGVTSNDYNSGANKMKTQISELPLSLVEIGDSAFYGNTGVTFSKIPDGVVNLTSFAFTFCPNVNISELGKVSDGKLQYIGQYALHGTGYNITDLHIYSSVNTIGQAQFNSGWTNLKTVYFARTSYSDGSGNNYDALDEAAQTYWGLNASVATHVLT